MRKINHVRFLLVLSLGIASITFEASAQNGRMNNTNFEQKRFIENKTQFNGRGRLGSAEILYGVDWGALQIYFTKQGLTYRVDKRDEISVENKSEHEREEEERSAKTSSEFISIEWENSNINTEIVAEGLNKDYFSYTVEGKNFNNLKSYSMLIYKNLYANIDVVYEFHPQGGIEYSLILHPGADITNVKMHYTGAREIETDKGGNIHFATLIGDIVEHAPLAFYYDKKEQMISSCLIKNKNTFSFSLGNYDKTKTIVIDPWVKTPVLPSSNCVWECEHDKAGNVYVIGGDHPMKLQKYDANGNLKWTYSTPWDTASGWLGTLATDLSGNSYITNGSIAAIQKINTAGGLVWSNVGGNMDEYWALSFNCDYTELIAGGTRLVTAGGMKGYGTAYKIDLTSGVTTNTLAVANTFPGEFGVIDPNEIRALCSSSNGNYYFLTPDTIGAINSSFIKTFAANNGDTLSYKCENWKPKGSSGILAIKANENFVYANMGSVIEKRSLTNGAIITSTVVPGGIANVSLGFKQVGNSGIDVDSCGNVYVGSGNAVIQYDANLSLLNSFSLPFHVYDVSVNRNGEVIVVGATGVFSNAVRTGYVQSVNMSACAPIDSMCLSFTSVPDVLQKENISVYPNPSNGKFTIKCAEQFSKIEIYNLLGEKTYVAQINSDIAEVILDKHLSDVYFLHISFKDKTEVKKIILRK
jgi:hypothetical protein